MRLLKFFNLKKTFIIATIVILIVTVKLLDLAVDSNEKSKSRKYFVSNETVTLEKNLLKIFHLDLKGAAPKLHYLLKILPVVRKAGANAILIEYEDMFPFGGRLANISARNAYLLKEVKILIEFAESLQMEVIPLVQTFGHLEYVLKLEEFENLREVDDFPQEICPLKRKATALVKEIIKQIMGVHQKSRYLHLGCDEVRHVGICPRCSRSDPKKLFSKHVTKIANFVKSVYPKVTPLIWDDMLRRWTFNDLESSGLGSVVEPVVWVYGDNIFQIVPPVVWNSYQRIFPKLWVASAFKGAFGPTEILPNLTLHLKNHLSWMKILTRADEELTVKPSISGIFITGWSRYDHFAVLCELLPAGIPSLVLSLTFLDPEVNGNRSVGFTKWTKTLQCPQKYTRSRGKNEVDFQHKIGNCTFPGSGLYLGIVEFDKLKRRVAKVRNSVESGGWTSDYNVRKRFTSTWRLVKMFPEEGFGGEVLRREISTWKSGFLSQMRDYFDDYTIKEWEEQNVKPLEDKLKEIQNNFGKMVGRRKWPRRPLG